MKEVQPVVIKIAETKAYPVEIARVVRMLGGSKDAADRMMNLETSGAEQLIETAGRICYKSYEPGLNPNVTKIRVESADYFRNIIAKGDGSVMEHSTVSFALLNVSRVMTHEIVRHRVGTAFSQESLRYVRPKDIGLWVPPELNEEQSELLQKIFGQAEEGYRLLEKTVDWDKVPFDLKKRLTSAFRRILPDGMATNIIFTANHRTLRWLIEMRTDPAAEVEIRMVFDQIAQILKRDYPLLYQDFVRTELPDGTGQWKPLLRSKV